MIKNAQFGQIVRLFTNMNLERIQEEKKRYTKRKKRIIKCEGEVRRREERNHEKSHDEISEESQRQLKDK